jgi:hypothetical protein
MQESQREDRTTRSAKRCLGKQAVRASKIMQEETRCRETRFILRSVRKDRQEIKVVIVIMYR